MGLFSTRQASAFPDAAVYNFWNSSVEPVATRLLGVSSALRARTIDAGQEHPLWEVAGYVDWQQRVFGYRLKVYSRREKLWEQLARRLDPKRPLFVLEFGVAWGYATDWWLRRLAGRDVTWHGFDRFTGLPRSWRGMEAGAFDAGGQAPAIDDSRVHWHVGDVENTLADVNLAAHRDALWLILFDLDIYEPSAYAWDVVKQHLRPGDAIYFDEAMDRDERRLLDEAVLPSIGCELVGTTPMALAFCVTRAAHAS